MATADKTTVARPYAKAAFDVAVEQQAIEQGASALSLLGAVCENQQVARLLKNPLMSKEQLAQFFIEICDSQSSDAIKNLILTLADNKRLATLPEISTLFALHRAEYEKTIEVDVHSFMPLSDSQSLSIKQSLEKRLARKISLNHKIDKALLGGAVIYAGDLVFDGSVRGKLDKLASEVIA